MEKELNLGIVYFIITATLAFVFMIIYLRLWYLRVIRIATKKIIIPTLNNNNYTLIRVERLFTLFGIMQKKGDFEYEYEGLFHNTRYNRKFYILISYADKENIERKCTAKICCNFLGLPIRVEYKPDELI